MTTSARGHQATAYWLRLRVWLFYAATGAPMLEGLRLTDPGAIVRSFAREVGLRTPWWALPVRDYDRDLTVFWWSALWWWIVFCRARYYWLWRPLVKSGLWRVPELGLYTEGRLQWPDMWSRMR